MSVSTDTVRPTSTPSPTMFPVELCAALTTLRWGPTALGAELGVAERTVRRWLNADFPIPAPVATWLRALVAAPKALPAPVATRRERK